VTAPTLAADPVVFVVDDEDTVRRALARLIRAAGYRVEDYASASEFLPHALQTPTLACVILDVRMPELGGLELQRELNAANVTLPIIFITGHGDIPTTVSAMKAGATDFLAKPIEDTDLLQAVEKALRAAQQAMAKRDETWSFTNRLARLTPREREVLALLVDGRLNKQAAFELGITEKTIKVHRARVMEKMGVRSLVELARATDRAGIRLEADPAAPRAAS
jgi:FixJ family two-component response regulator